MLSLFRGHNVPFMYSVMPVIQQARVLIGLGTVYLKFKAEYHPYKAGWPTYMASIQNSLCRYNNSVHGLCRSLSTQTNKEVNKIWKTPFSRMQSNSTKPQWKGRAIIPSLNTALSHWIIVGLSLFLFRHLIKCLVDSGKMEDAASFAKVTEEFIKSHTPHLYPRLFMLLVNSISLLFTKMINI